MARALMQASGAAYRDRLVRAAKEDDVRSKDRAMCVGVSQRLPVICRTAPKRMLCPFLSFGGSRRKIAVSSDWRFSLLRIGFALDLVIGRG